MDTVILELANHPWALWLLIALACAILEVALPHLMFAFASGAAFLAMGAALSLGWTLQILTFGVALLVSLTFARPRLLNRFNKTYHKMPSRAQALVGARGEVTEAIDPLLGTGRISVNGQDWAARSTQPFALGKTIVVDGHDGIVLTVKES